MTVRQTWLIATGISFILIALTIALGSYQLGQRAASPTAVALLESTQPPPPVIITNTPTPTSTPSPTRGATATITPTPTETPIAVLNKVTALGRLETTEFAMQTVIDLADEPTSLWQNIFGTDKLMLVAEGEVVAGIDLSKLDPDKITVKGKTVKIILPPTEILHSRIDNEKTYVYQRDTGIFITPNKDLESRARQLAEQRLTEWAIERGIHDKAAKSAQLQLENLLRSLGFTEITIEITQEPL